jgi:putative ABC transport system permease protein
VRRRGHAGRSRLRAADIGPLAVLGPRGRPVRAALSAIGVAIGVATLVAVLGISASSRAQLIAQIDALGTNLLTVAPNNGFSGQAASLPERAPAMISRIGPVTSDAATADLAGAVFRNQDIPTVDSQAITVKAAATNLLTTVQAHMWAGHFLDAADTALPAVVLGHDAAAALGVDQADGSVVVWLSNCWFDVIGILEPVPLAPELDRAALVGFPAARRVLHQHASPTDIYVRTNPTSVSAVQSVLAATADPAAPQDAAVTNPSDALTARADASAAFQSLFLSLGAIALLVGGIGIANVMVIGVLERRGEIGLRCAMGARRVHVALQFLGEAAALSVAGGVAGAVLGALAVTIYAAARNWGTAVPLGVLAGAVGVALGVGAIGGLYPAWRASRLSPAEALRSS